MEATGAGGSGEASGSIGISFYFRDAYVVCKLKE
jgi:hypothetical protein